MKANLFEVIYLYYLVHISICYKRWLTKISKAVGKIGSIPISNKHAAIYRISLFFKILKSIYLCLIKPFFF